MNNQPIGIFDSGVGGLTVLAEIKKKLPNENIVYIGDTANFPYGDKKKDDIIKYSRENVKTLIEHNAKIVVIACGTATSQAIDVLQKEFEIPIIGIIDPTVQYIKERNITEIGVIATEGTIRSGAWERELKKEINNINVVNKACPMLATIAEEGRALSQEGRQVIKEYMEGYLTEISKLLVNSAQNFVITGSIVDLIVKMCGVHSDGINIIEKTRFTELYKNIKKKTPQQMHLKPP